MSFMILKDMQQVVPLITRATVFCCQDVCGLVFGFDILDLDFWVQVDSVKKPVKSNSVGAGHMFHRRTSAFDDHLNHCFVVFENVQL